MEKLTYHDLLKKYRSADVSILKAVPIELLDEVRAIMWETYPSRKIRVRYRGPHRQGHDTLKKDAYAFSVYFA